MGALPEEQSGFRPNRCATDTMFVIRPLQVLARKKQIPLYVCFIDLTKRTTPFLRATEYELGHSSIPRWYASMHAARRQGVLGAVRCRTGPSPRVRARAPPVQHLLRGGYKKRGLDAFQGGQKHIWCTYLKKKKGAGGRGEATAEEPVLATPLWGMLYADDAEVVSQSPEQLRKMMGVIVVVCAAFGLTVSEAKTEIMCLRTKGVPASTATFSVEAAGQVYRQTNEFVYLGGDVNHNADLSIKVNRRIRNAWCNFRKYTLELYHRPSAPLELRIRMLRAEVLKTMMQCCVTGSPRACHDDTLRRAHHSFLTRCTGCRKNNHAEHPPIWTRLSRREVRASR